MEVEGGSVYPMMVVEEARMEGWWVGLMVIAVMPGIVQRAEGVRDCLVGVGEEGILAEVGASVSWVHYLMPVAAPATTMQI